ncbi:proline-rich protein HaeIII subfamily 1-like [Diceros bicornis minor]|uniref:proline-rich protein HaeIII subfamily 1-like n=1 Tax=Diceros bicornis minor TaxID=77932 RepID=UPI0026ED5EAB|nr:proline-rich protein HaeIII subfamily 1-like [Diceros bicornis minor]
MEPSAKGSTHWAGKRVPGPPLRERKARIGVPGLQPALPLWIPGTTGRTFFPLGPGLGNRSGRSGAGSPPERPGLSPRLRLRRSPPPRPAVRAPGAAETTVPEAPARPGDPRRTREAPPPPPPRGGRSDRLPGPGPPPLLPGIPCRQHPPGLRRTLPSEAGPRPPAAPAPPRALRRGTPGPTPPPGRPPQRDGGGMVTGQRREAGSRAGRRGGRPPSPPPPRCPLPAC